MQEDNYNPIDTATSLKSGLITQSLPDTQETFIESDSDEKVANNLYKKCKNSPNKTQFVSVYLKGRKGIHKIMEKIVDIAKSKDQHMKVGIVTTSSKLIWGIFDNTEEDCTDVENFCRNPKTKIGFYNGSSRKIRGRTSN